jgi:nitroreductase
MDSMIQAMNKRRSIRTYREEPIAREQKKKILDSLRSNGVGPFGNETRFEFIDLTELDKQEIRSLGTYGVIKGARSYLVSATKNSEKAMVDLGYCLEKTVLRATSLGLGTCWMAGSFNRSGFAKRIDVTDTEIVPIVCPVGYPRDRRAFADMLMRLLAGSHRRKEWKELFFHGSVDNPLEWEHVGEYTAPLECVRIAPSASNKQPWRIIKKEGDHVYHFWLKRLKRYSKLFTFGLQDIDMGIAMCHFELAAVEKGLNGRWETDRATPDMNGMEYIVSWVGQRSSSS